MKGLFVRNGIWWMRFTINGRQYRRSTGATDKKVAEKIYHKVMTDIAERRYLISLKHLNPYFSGMILADITSKDISAYYQKRKDEGAAVATINREFDLISKAFNLAWKQWEWCKENPCQKVQKEPENNQVDRWLTPDEEERLLKACYNSASSPYSSSKNGYLNGQLPDIVTLSLHTAMRQGEILNLKWQDVDLFRKVITVTKTKNKHPKTIPMNYTAYDILFRRRQGKVVSISGYVFATENGTRIRERNLVREWYKALKKAGISNFRFHDLRHTAATRMIQSGVDIYTVSKILGHRDIKTTTRYAHHYPESLRPGVMVLDKISTKLAQSNNNNLSKASNPLIFKDGGVAQLVRAEVS